MKYLSVCSGIEAATAAWHPIGWEAVAYSEIEKFPSAVLAHHYPDTPNLGDMLKHHEWNIESPDILVGGTPCQSYSVAGLRKGLEDPRGNLTLAFLGLVDQFHPTWVVWENVPGILSDKGNAFGQFLSGLGKLGYQFAYRVLDAQHFGVPQRRRRVFVVANSGGIHPAEVLFEPESLSRDLAPGREAREAAPTIPSRSTAGGGLGTDFDCDGGLVAHSIAPAITTNPYGDHESREGSLIPQVANPLTARMAKGINTTLDEGQTPIPVAFSQRERGDDGRGYDRPPQVFEEGKIGALDTVKPHCVATSMQVRRLTPRECERLQGFQDDFTRIPWRGRPADACPDGPRYKALGNSMAVPVMRWIGERIQRISP